MTSRQLPPPGPFDIHGDGCADRWAAWKDRWSCYAVATKLGEDTAEIQVSTFLMIIGPEAHAIFRTFTWTNPADKSNLTRVLIAFDEYCEPRKNTAYERYRFNMRGQAAGESFDRYVTALRQLSMRCSFDTINKEEILRDRLVFGVQSQVVRDRLLRESNLTLAKTLNIRRGAEMSAS